MKPTINTKGLIRNPGTIYMVFPISFPLLFPLNRGTMLASASGEGLAKHQGSAARD